MFLLIQVIYQTHDLQTLPPWLDLSFSLSFKHCSFKLFLDCALVRNKNSLLSYGHKDFSPIFFKSFIILGFTFRSVIPLELLFEYVAVNIKAMLSTALPFVDKTVIIIPFVENQLST